MHVHVRGCAPSAFIGFAAVFMHVRRGSYYAPKEQHHGFYVFIHVSGSVLRYSLVGLRYNFNCLFMYANFLPNVIMENYIIQ